MLTPRPLYGHTPAFRVRSGSQSMPGLCRSQATNEIGWFVPVRTGLFGPYVRIDLHVRDPHSGFTCHAPFLVDTGAEATVIPRRYLTGLRSEAAFPPRNSLGWKPFHTAGGPRAISVYEVAMMLAPSGGVPAFSFLDVEAAVPEEWPSNMPGILGFDLLSQLIVVADAHHVCFWPPRQGLTSTL